MEPFTKEERLLAAKFLHRRPGPFWAVFDYSAYVLPSVLMAGYGMWTRDFVAVSVGYGALLIAVVAYLSYQHSHASQFYSLVRKYEERCGALGERTEARAEPTPHRTAAPPS
jgi:hypothetical protein